MYFIDDDHGMFPLSLCLYFSQKNNGGELYYVTSRTQNPAKHLRKFFARIINVFQQSTIFEKGSILDI